MSEKKRQKKDGGRQEGKTGERRGAVAARKGGQKGAQLPKDKSNHLIGDDASRVRRGGRS
ncbi:MAG: hypothetical protein LC746_06425 [Acidobacteria bacterium]|nr:hypothetical protein [Acidobacteriota bacterium]